MKAERLTVYCDEPFHEGAPAEVRIFARIDGEWLIADPSDDLILGNQPFFATDQPLASAASGTRDRRRLSCACGAGLIMRAEKLESLLSKLVDGGVERISLSRLNLLVSIPR
jgi:hypothetical protein